MTPRFQCRRGSGFRKSDQQLYIPANCIVEFESAQFAIRLECRLKIADNGRKGFGIRYRADTDLNHRLDKWRSHEIYDAVVAGRHQGIENFGRTEGDSRIVSVFGCDKDERILFFLFCVEFL